jgi:hypothetical protein
MTANAHGPTAEEMLDLIHRMTPRERQRLREALERLPNPFGDFVLCAKGMLDLFGETSEHWLAIYRHLIDGYRLADKLMRDRNRKPSATSVALRAEADRLKQAGMPWRQVAERLWQEHPELFPDDPRPEDLTNLPGHRDELLTLLQERVRKLCRRKRRRK